jgi:uncharacterized membrane protein
MTRSSRVSLNVLFALQILLLFLLVFENKIQVPLWLEVGGRLHPAIVHLPIGFISLFLILYLFRKQFKKKVYHKISFFVLLLTSLSAVVAAIFGLFLSHQGDYESISFHKWSAVVFNFICYGALILMQAKLLDAALAVVTFVVLLAQVIVVGHSGGELTHGKGYVFAPLHKEEKSVDPATASAYEVAVLPVLEKKCFSCHNESKAKGKLIMTSVEKFIKGGENGPAFVPGDVSQSRMMKNIALPLEHDDHMPPEGKPQLSADEKKILSTWIKSGAPFDKKLTDLASDDSLRILGSKKIVVEKKEVTYSFEPASASVIEKLNTPFRVVFPLYKSSPALRADFFIAEMYKPEALQDLKEIKTQLVELSLSKIPVTDKELDIISGFSNLEKLNLNFTKISGSNLNVLNQLKNLQSLSLAGTAINSDQLHQISIPSLKELFIWNTSVTAEQVAALKSKWKSTRILTTEFSDDKILRLSLPSLTKNDVLKKDGKVELKHPMKGVTIRYTIDGTLPDSVTGKIYDQPFAVGQTSRLKTIACKQGWYCSGVLESICFVEGIKPASVQLLTQPDKTYTGEGATTLSDGKLGQADQYKEPVWLGYHDGAMQAQFSFVQPQPIKTISVSYAKNLGSYLFPPLKIEVWAGNDKRMLSLIKTVVPTQPTSYTDGTKKEVSFIEVGGKPFSIYKIIVTPVPVLPAWHGGKGDKAWVFVDEVFFN